MSDEKRPQTSKVGQSTAGVERLAVPTGRGSAREKGSGRRTTSGTREAAQLSAHGYRAAPGVTDVAASAVHTSSKLSMPGHPSKQAENTMPVESLRVQSLQSPRAHSGVPKRLSSIDVNKTATRVQQASIQSGGPSRPAACPPQKCQVTKVKSQLQSLLKNNPLGMAQMPGGLELSPQDTAQLMDLFEEARPASGSNMGKSAAQILMKNPIFRGLKKFLLKDQQIKNVIAQKTTLMDIVNKIKPLQTLCQPTKARFRSFMQMQMIKQDGVIPLSDVQHGDLIYVEKGCLEICFESLSDSGFDARALRQLRLDKKHDEEAEAQEDADEVLEPPKVAKKTEKKTKESAFDPDKEIKLRFSTGDYIDFTWKMHTEELKDRTIKYVRCVSYDPATEVSIRERIPVEQHASRKNLRTKKQSSQLKAGPASIPQSLPTTLRRSEQPAEDSAEQIAERPPSSRPASTVNGTESVEQESDSVAQAEKMWKYLSAQLKQLAASGPPDEEGQSRESQSSLSASSHEASCTFVRVPYAIYKEFVDYPLGKNQRNMQNMTDMLRDTLPYFANITVRKGQNILNEFEEVEYHGGPGGFRPGTVLEHEGQPCEHLYLILRGEVHFYKRILGLYDEVEVHQAGQPSRIACKLTNIDGSRPLENFVNLKESGNKSRGVYLGSLKGPWDAQDRAPKCSVIAGEDSVLVKQPNNYTLVAGENTLLFRFPVRNAFQIWPTDTLRQLERNIAHKYAWLQHRTRNIEAQLFKNPRNRTTLGISKQIDDRTALNYPNANERAKVLLKEDNMRIAEWNEQVYLGLQNRRIQSKYNHSTGDENGLVKVKVSGQTPEQKRQEEQEAKQQKPTLKPLRGAVNEQLLTRMEQLKHSLFTGQKEYCFFRSATLAEIQLQEQEEQNQINAEQKRPGGREERALQSLQTLLRPKGAAQHGFASPESKNVSRACKLRMSSGQPALAMKRVEDLMSGRQATETPSKRSRLQVAATFGSRRLQSQSSGTRPATTHNIARRKPLGRQADPSGARETAPKNLETQTASTLMAAHPSITLQVQAPMQNLNLASQQYLVDSPTLNLPLSPSAAAQQYPGQQSRPSQLLQLDLPGQMNMDGRGSLGAGVQHQNGPALHMSATEASKLVLRAASQSPPPNPMVAKAMQPGMSASTQKREQRAASRGSSAKVPTVRNIANNASDGLLQESKVSNMHPAIGRIEVLNTNFQRVGQALAGDGGGVAGHGLNQQTLPANWHPQAHAHQNYNISALENSQGVLSQDSASLHGNEKIVMTSKNINMERKTTKLGDRDDQEEYQGMSTNTKSASAAQMSPEMLAYRASKSRSRGLAINTRQNALKTKSSEFIMSSTTTKAAPDSRWRNETQQNLTGRQQASANIFSGRGAGPTPKSTKAIENRTLAGQRRAGHNRNLTTYNMSAAETRTLAGPILFEQDFQKPESSHLTHAGNDIRPGSIYSSHRHAQRKFQNQKNIQTNRNYLIMQTQMQQKGAAFSGKEKYLRRKALNSGARPQTHGTALDVTMRSSGGPANGRALFSATQQRRDHLRQRFLEDDGQSPPQPPKSGAAHYNRTRQALRPYQTQGSWDPRALARPYIDGAGWPLAQADRAPTFDPSIATAMMPSKAQGGDGQAQLQQQSQSLAPSRDTPPPSVGQPAKRAPFTDIRIPMQQEMALGAKTGEDSSDVALGHRKQSLQEHTQTVDEQKNNKDLLHLVGAIQITDNQGGDETMVPTQERVQEKDVSPTTPMKFGPDQVLYTQDQSYQGANETSPNTVNLSSLKCQSFAQNQLSSVYAGGKP